MPSLLVGIGFHSGGGSIGYTLFSVCPISDENITSTLRAWVVLTVVAVVANQPDADIELLGQCIGNGVTGRDDRDILNPRALVRRIRASHLDLDCLSKKRARITYPAQWICISDTSCFEKSTLPEFVTEHAISETADYPC